MKVKEEVPGIFRNEEIDIGTSYIPDLKTFHSPEFHKDVTTYNYSDQWGIRLS